MTCELEVLKRLRVYEEAAGAATFGVDNSASPSSFLDVAAIEGTIKATDDQEVFDPKLASVYTDGHDQKVLGRLSASLSFATSLHSHGVALNGVNALPTISTWAQMRMLKAIFGATSTPTNGGARTVQAGSTTTVVNVTAGRGADFTAGQAIGVRTGTAATAIECAEIASIATDALTLVEALSATPVTGATVNGAVTVYLTENPDTSLQFLLEGTESNDRRIFCGMQSGVKITLPIGEVPQISFDFKGPYWARLSGSTVAAGTLAFTSIFAAVYNCLRVPTMGSTTRLAYDHSVHTIEPGIVYAPVRSGTGVNGVLRHRRQKARPVCKGSFVTIFEDSTWEDHVTAKTHKRIDNQLGNLPGSCILVSQRDVEILPVKDGVHESGIGGQMIPYEARIPDAASTALTRSALALHFF